MLKDARIRELEAELAERKDGFNELLRDFDNLGEEWRFEKARAEKAEAHLIEHDVYACCEGKHEPRGEDRG